MRKRELIIRMVVGFLIFQSEVKKVLTAYRTLARQGRGEISMKKSRFVGTALPVSSQEQAWEFIQKVRKEHPSAAHNVFAFLVGPRDDLKRCSDDGEPSGTGGKPVLEVLEREELRDVLVVVTRYFGGILLGAPGLVRAYSKAAALGVRKAGIITRELYRRLEIVTQYTYLGKLQNEIPLLQGLVEDVQYRENVTVTCLFKPEDLESAEGRMGDLTGGQGKIRRLDYTYVGKR